jgi:hypothetical protein
MWFEKNLKWFFSSIQGVFPSAKASNWESEEIQRVDFSQFYPFPSRFFNVPAVVTYADVFGSLQMQKHQ